MPFRTLLLLLALLAVAVAAAWFATRESAAAPPAGGVDVVAPATGTTPTDTSATPPGVAEAAADAVRSDVPSPAGLQPLPRHAEWLDLIVVDPDGEPVAGADVFWHDENAFGRLMRRRVDDPMQAFAVLWHRPEDMFPHAGWHTQSDALGRARVTLSAAGVVVALHEGLYGRMDLRPRFARPPEGLRMTLRPDRHLSVRVVDDLGAACSGVPVTVAVIDPDGHVTGPIGWSAMAVTDDDGRAEIPHLQELQTAVTSQPWLHDGAHRVVVRALLPGLTDPGATVSLTEAEPAPIVLQLPTCGSLRVAARGFEGLVGLRRFVLRDAEGDFGLDRMAAVAADGWARFLYVPVGCAYLVADADGHGEGVRVDGPVARGQEVEVLFRPAPGAILLRGRLLDANGAPAADRAVTVEVACSDLLRWTAARSDADGRFVAVVEHLEPPAVADRLDVQFDDADGADEDYRVVLPGRTLVAGVNDLGDLTPAVGEALLTGQLVADDAPFTKPSAVWLERFDPTAERAQSTGAHEPDEPWNYVPEIVGRVAEDGSFVLRGRVGPGRYRLGVYSEHALPREPIEVALGARDLRVELEPAAAVAASLLLPEYTPTEQVVVELVAASEAGEGERFPAYVQLVQGRRYGVDWSGVRPGRYALEVRPWVARAPTVRIPDVELPPPATGDPRLVDLDLRAAWRVVEVRVFDPNGAPLTDTPCVVFPAGQPADTGWLGLPASETPSGAVAHALLPAGPYDLLVTAAGYRPTPLFGDAARASVRLGAWGELRVAVADVPSLPDGVQVSVRARAAVRSAQSWQSLWSEAPLDTLLGGEGPAAPLVDGAATVRCSDGLLQIELLVEGPEGAETLAGVTPPQVLSTAGRVALRASTEAWQRAIAAVTTEAR